MKNIILFTLAFLFISTVAISQTIHAIMVFQDDAPGSMKDREIFPSELEDISRLTNMPLRKYEYDKDDTQYISTIQNLSVGSDDVVLFYYSGHAANSGDGWPKISVNGSAIHQTDLHAGLRRKGARLTCTFFDCCNVGNTGSEAPHISTIGARNVAATYALMFKNSTGQIKATSSADGLYSYGTSETGGFFTSSFIEAMHTVSLTPDDQGRIWREVLNTTKSMANDMCSQIGKTAQNPKFEIDLVTDQLDIQNAPDLIKIGEGDAPLFNTMQEIVDYYKNDPSHTDLTLQKLKEWNPGLTDSDIRRGKTVNLVAPTTNVIRF